MSGPLAQAIKTAQEAGYKISEKGDKVLKDCWDEGICFETGNPWEFKDFFQQGLVLRFLSHHSPDIREDVPDKAPQEIWVAVEKIEEKNMSHKLESHGVRFHYNLR